MPTIAWEEVTRATLFVRSDLPTPAGRCRENITSRLAELVASDAIGEFSVSSWAKRVPLDADAGVGQRERDLYRRFDDWARAAGVDLAPFFDTRECYSSTTGERQTQLVMPAVCVALYDDAELVGVLPHATETGSVSVADGLDRLTDADSGPEPPVSATMAD